MNNRPFRDVKLPIRPPRDAYNRGRQRKHVILRSLPKNVRYGSVDAQDFLCGSLGSRRFAFNDRQVDHLDYGVQIVHVF